MIDWVVKLRLTMFCLKFWQRKQISLVEILRWVYEKTKTRLQQKNKLEKYAEKRNKWTKIN